MTDGDLRQRLESVKSKMEWGRIHGEIKAIEAASANPAFWQDRQFSTERMKKLAFLQKEIGRVGEIEALLDSGETASAEKKIGELELRAFLSGEYDSSPAILSVHAGQGGVEAMDWAQMLKRMYMMYANRKKWPCEVVDETFGDEAGIKSVVIKIDAPYAYGHLRREAGTHRLVRQSPFNADKLRQTSFALVEVLPQVQSAAVDIKEGDLEWQFYHSSSQGGQNVQKVSTAVRLTHKPTGIIVTAQSERYQERNRQLALDLLRSKLWARAEAERQSQEERLKGGRKMAAWGTQIRSYVLHPYRMVKDLRTDWETASTDRVLDGEIDGLIEAELRILP